MLCFRFKTIQHLLGLQYYRGMLTFEHFLESLLTQALAVASTHPHDRRLTVTLVLEIRGKRPMDV